MSRLFTKRHFRQHWKLDRKDHIWRCKVTVHRITLWPFSETVPGIREEFTWQRIDDLENAQKLELMFQSAEEKALTRAKNYYRELYLISDVAARNELKEVKNLDYFS